VLKDGGNAVDAGVAVALALAVTLPRAGNLGGGGFMMVHDAETGETRAIDYREMAPASATRDMYLDADGNADSTLSRFHGLAVGVPGTVAGMQLALETYGTMTLEQAAAPAIRLAEDGILVTADLADSLKALEKRMKTWPATAAIFYKEDGSFYEPGDVLKQPDLAATLKKIATEGPDGFYRGEVAEKIAASVQEAGGSMTVEDLANYRAVIRAPVTGTYRGHEIVSMPPPSSGGTHIIQILNVMEGYPIGFLGHNSSDTIHLMAEAMKRAYADRSEYLGDPDFVDVPVKALTSKDYAAKIRDGISLNRATPSATIKPGKLAPYESDQTTHFSIVDKDGNAVSNTYTLNFSYGSGMTAAGTGVLLNNEMDDFSAKPGVPNAYGLIGGEANAVEPRQAALVLDEPDDRAQGRQAFPGHRQPRRLAHHHHHAAGDLQHDRPRHECRRSHSRARIHHQWLPDEIRVEDGGLSRDTVAALEAKGHTIAVKSVMGSTQSIHVDTDKGLLLGASDPRRTGSATVGY
jgi:gamma-glutamyltranspeptidase/glutathione hydrolase